MSVQASARSTLNSLVEEHITTLVREAAEVKRHSKRARLHQTSKDDDRGVVRHRLHAEDINLALQWRGSEKLYATGTVIPRDDEDPRDHPSNRQVNLGEYLKSEMPLKPPSETGLTVHWLAVDGVQPEIPHNPAPEEGGKQYSLLHPIPDHHSPFDEPSSIINAGGESGGGVHVSQLQPRLLSEELQLYFTRVTLAIQMGGATPISRQQQDAALVSVSRDPGLQELVPFFVKYVGEEIQKHLGNPEHCRTLVRLTQSMLLNPHMHLELHLHLILPPLITCIGRDVLQTLDTDNHWALRREASQTLIRLCNLFGDEYQTLKPKVIKILCGAIKPDEARTTIYGGIVALSFFGANAIKGFLLPVVASYWRNWEGALDEKKLTDTQTRTELHKCQQAVLDALSIFLRSVCRVSEHAPFISWEEIMRWEEIEETFGDALVPYSEHTDYSFCFV